MKKSCEIYGITPLNNLGDKYSSYDDENYSYSIFMNLNKMGVQIDNINIIKGLSTDLEALNEASASGPYDIIYIDGCHDYNIVCKDIQNYLPMLKSGGYLVMDDSSLFLEKPYGRFLGHKDVCQAIKDTIDGRPDLKHILAVGHNRVWVKN
jgi:predicted O-methyltransferase YrrM